jgi:hypothetical protein
LNSQKYVAVRKHLRLISCSSGVESRMSVKRTKPCPMCSTPEPQLVTLSVEPIMKGGTPKAPADVFDAEALRLEQLRVDRLEAELFHVAVVGEHQRLVRIGEAGLALGPALRSCVDLSRSFTGPGIADHEARLRALREKARREFVGASCVPIAWRATCWITDMLRRCVKAEAEEMQHVVLVHAERLADVSGELTT